ncbi:MAG: hypothetical protein ACI8ZM_001436 [Crocinitomix sp.]|jgi:hypothetical protein
MKAKLSLLIATLFCTTLSSFAQDFIYHYVPQTIESTTILIRDVIKTSDDHLVAAFDLEGSTIIGAPMGGIMKLGSNGDPVWTKLFNVLGTAANCAFEVIENASGNYLMWGLNKNLANDHMEALLFEVTQNGEVLWSKKYDFDTNPTSNYTVNRMMLLPSGELEMMITIFNNLIILRTTAEGEIIWGHSTNLFGPDEWIGKRPGFDMVSLPGDGGIVSNKFGNDFALIRYGEDGETYWTKRYSIGSYMHPKSILQMPSGNFMIGGFATDSITGAAKPLIMEVSDEDGSILWIKRINEYEIALLSNLRLYYLEEDFVASFSTGTGLDNYQVYVRFDVEGNIISSAASTTKTVDINRLEVIDETEIYAYGSSMYGTGLGMIQRSSNLFEGDCRNELVTVTTENFTDYVELESEALLMDFSAVEESTISLIDLDVRVMDYCSGLYIEQVDGNPFEEEQHEDPINGSGIEENETVLNIYPNPSSGLVNISVSPAFVNATYTLHSTTGQTVLSGLIIAEQLRIDLTNLENGHYILSIQNKDEIKTKRITVLK